MTPRPKAPPTTLPYTMILRLLPQISCLTLSLLLTCLSSVQNPALPALAATAQTAPIIFNYSAQAGPGDIINLQGQFFGERPRVLCSIDGARPIGLPVVNHGVGVVHAQLPAAPGLYRLWIKNSSLQSDGVDINLPRATFATVREVRPRQNLSIYGRNLNLRSKGYQPQVNLARSLSKNGYLKYEAQIVSCPSAGEMTVSIPQSVTPGDYTLTLTNSQSSEQSPAVSSDEPIHIKVVSSEKKYRQYNVKTDPSLKLHVTGDGQTNDQPAIQEAINTAVKAGGGTIYLPQGKYKLQTNAGPLLTIGKNILLRGEGADKTIITYGHGRPGQNFYVVAFEHAMDSGIQALAIENRNENNVWQNSGSIATTSRDCKNISLLGVKADLKNSNRIELKGEGITVSNCDLKAEHTLLFMCECTNSKVANCTLTQKLGVHLDLTLSDCCEVRKNIFFLDANQGKAESGNVRHGMAIGFARNLAIVDNTWSVVNGRAVCNNDGEAILSEGGGGNRLGEEFGAVVAADASTLTGNKTAKYVPGTVVAIVEGRGMGQWRAIKQRQDKKIVLDRPLRLIPDKTSRYAVFIWSSRNTFISGNTFDGWPRGLWIYQGSTVDTQISNNRFNRMDGIFLEPCQNTARASGQFNPIWNTLVDNNSVSSGTEAGYINITADLQQTSKLMGTLGLNIQFYKNKMTGNKSKIFHNDPACFEGYCNYLRVEAPHFEEDTSRPIPAILGTIYQHNSATGCAQSYLLNGGVYQTTIWDCKSDGASPELNDSNMYWNTPGTYKSVGTVVSTSAGH